MTLDEFLHWDDGTGTRYELIDGVPAAIPLSFEAQRILTTRLCVRIDRALARRRPCNVQTSVGIVRPGSDDCFFVADIAATCAPIDAFLQTIQDPFLVVEALSPNTERHDRRVKLPVYRQIESIEEILLVASDDIYAEVHRRSGAQWIIEILLGRDAAINLTSVPVEIGLADLYEDIAIAEVED